MEITKNQIRDVVFEVVKGLETRKIVNMDFIFSHEIQIAHLVIEIGIEEFSSAKSELFFQACLYILDHCIMFLNSRVGSDERVWAGKQLNDLQQYIAKIILREEVDEEVKMQLVETLVDAGIPLTDELKKAWSEDLEASNAGPLLEMSGQDPITALNNIITSFFEATDEVYDVFDQLLSHMSLLDEQFMIDSMYAFFRSPVIKAREIPFLMLLHQDISLRTKISRLLVTLINKENVSPTSLRRLIMMRNWLLEEERGVIDTLIKQSRKLGIVCDAYSNSLVEKVFATAIDGSGTQAIVIVSRGLGGPGQNNVSGFLVKRNYGIKDTWLLPHLKDFETDDLLDEIGSMHELETVEMDLEWFDMIVRHGLALGISSRHVPPTEFLRIVEMCQLPLMTPQVINTEFYLEELWSSLSPEEKNLEAIDRAIKASADWEDIRPYTVSWFEHDPQMDKLLQETLEMDTPNEENFLKATEILLKQEFEKKREQWCSQLLLMAIWAKHVVHKDKEHHWQDFLILSKLLHDGVELKSLPFMFDIATRSVQNYANRHLPR